MYQRQLTRTVDGQIIPSHFTIDINADIDVKPVKIEFGFNWLQLIFIFGAIGATAFICLRKRA